MNKLEILGKGLHPAFYLNNVAIYPTEVKLYCKDGHKTIAVIKFDVDELFVDGDVVLALEATKKTKKKH